jgi:predicted O-linked N-acetylglucosamine transferase (SPINDLY family)
MTTPAFNLAFNTGIALIKQRQFRRAADQLSQATRLDPHSPAAHCNLGFALLELGQHQNALNAFETSIALNPRSGVAHLGRANALRNLGQTTDAITGYRRTIVISPELVDAHLHMANLLCATGDTTGGIESYRAALNLQPNHFNALTLLGNTLMVLERFGEAETAFRRVVDSQPRLAIGWLNLGNLFMSQGRLDDAQREYERAIQLDGSLAAAYCNLGTVLKDRGKAEAAVAALRRAVGLDPTSTVVHSNLVYTSCFCPGYGAQQLLDEARAFAERFERPLLKFHRLHDNDRDQNRRLKIGYLSADLRDHVVGRNVLPILEHHDHNQFEIHAFSLAAPNDPTSEPFKKASDHWHECAALSDENLADEIRRLRIDILVDLTLHMSGNRLGVFARKPAPVQVTWAGYPGTTGLSSIDFRLTDPHLDPPGETDAFYSERSIRLPHSFWCYRPSDKAPEVNSLPALSAGYITFGCLNNFSKVTTAALDLWCEVLHAVAESKMVLLSTTGSVRTETAAHFARQAIDPTRLLLADRGGGYFREYHRIDICLDPLPYTGHSTTLDALWMGVPVITLRGDTSLARGSVTGLSNTGLTDLIAETREQYISIADRLANDPPRLARMRSELRSKMRSSPLCDEAEFTANFESALKEMWRRKSVG